MDAFGAARDAEGLCSFMARLEQDEAKRAVNVVNESTYERVAAALAPVGAWESVEAFVQVGIWAAEGDGGGGKVDCAEPVIH